MRKLRIVLEMIKFEHTVFALPFAFLGAALAARGLPGWSASLGILGAMVGARSAAMAFNRLADHQFDAANPRTACRPLPKGDVSRSFVLLFTVAGVALFFLSAASLNRLALSLAPIALAVVLCYSYTKRFTSFSHLFLGLSLAIAPVGGWVAVTGSLAWDPFILAGAVLFWVAGFDIIYSCQDVKFDQSAGLFSLPSRYGIPRALQVAAFFHVLMVTLLAVTFQLQALSLLSWAGLFIVAASLLYEHSIVSPTDLSRVDVAFFTLNGVVSAVLLLFVSLDLCLLV